MAEYVVLRDRNRLLRRGTFGSAGMLEGLAASTAPVPAEPTVSTHSLDSQGVREAAAEPDVVSLARVMPTRLIAPIAPAAEATAAGASATWGVTAVGAENSPVTGAGVRVAVLDTGIDRSHPAFRGVTLVEEDFSGSGNGDLDGHGTHCAGTVFGRDVDGLRIGVATGVSEALIGKVLADDGSGASDWLFRGMQWAVANDARVISMSLGFDFPGLVAQLEQEGLPVKLAASIALEGYRMNLRMFDRLMAMIRANAAFNGGTVVVAATGNESERQIDPNFEVSASVPAAAEGIVSVGALAKGAAGLTVAPFSNTNPVLSAPGVDVISARTGGGLASLSGTSMATPHVAGLAALWWQRLPELGVPTTPDGVAARLRATSTVDGFAPGVDIADRGAGLAQAPAAPRIS